MISSRLSAGILSFYQLVVPAAVPAHGLPGAQLVTSPAALSLLAEHGRIRGPQRGRSPNLTTDPSS
ncbi:hypothetical protein SSAG_00075 [Streptomyces sp. Mg1]|nr:hypothetical protein SSAG_00075 [Streptomyces sp. Mg1]